MVGFIIQKITILIEFVSRVIFLGSILALFMKETSNFCGIMSLTLKLINT